MSNELTPEQEAEVQRLIDMANREMESNPFLAALAAQAAQVTIVADVKGEEE
jgi:hypothetical protein